MMQNNEEKISLSFDEIPTPSLTLDSNEPAKAVEVSVTKNEARSMIDESNLSPEERKMVAEFSEKINIRDSNMVLQYGSNAQKKIAGFSETALNSVKTKDLGQVGDMITNLITELRGFDLDDQKGFMGFFKKTANKIQIMKTRYDSAEVNVEKICGVLENHQVQLLKDVAMLDKMYDLNLAYFKELSMYIIAGQKKLALVRETELPKIKEKAQMSGLPEDAQAANDYSSMCDRFEKKLHDLELTRMVSIQMAPQIRLVQNNDTLMTEKIQSTIVNTIPLWKSQMVLALGLAHSEEAMKAQRAVTDLTNELLRKNADTLKMGTIEVAKESERGIVDIETLKYTNQQLISTLDEVMRIQEEGREKRRQAEVELGRIEGELKQRLLGVRS